MAVKRRPSYLTEMPGLSLKTPILQPLSTNNIPFCVEYVVDMLSRVIVKYTYPGDMEHFTTMYILLGFMH